MTTRTKSVYRIQNPRIVTAATEWPARTDTTGVNIMHCTVVRDDGHMYDQRTSELLVVDHDAGVYVTRNSIYVATPKLDEVFKAKKLVLLNVLLAAWTAYQQKPNALIPQHIIALKHALRDVDVTGFVEIYKLPDQSDEAVLTAITMLYFKDVVVPSGIFWEVGIRLKQVDAIYVADFYFVNMLIGHELPLGNLQAVHVSEIVNEVVRLNGKLLSGANPFEMVEKGGIIVKILSYLT